MTLERGLGFFQGAVFFFFSLRLECVLGFFEGSLFFEPKCGLDFANSVPSLGPELFLGFFDGTPFSGSRFFLGFFHGTPCFFFAPKGDLDHIVLLSYNLSTPRLGSLTGSLDLDV